MKMDFLKMKVLIGVAALFMGSFASASASLTIVDEQNQPVSNASILLGFEPGNPFNGNNLRSGADGRVEVPSDWKAALPVTVQAPGFITATIPVLMPGAHQIELIKQEGNRQIEVQGTTQDYGRLITDGKVDFGLVIPGMTKDSMLSFDIASVLSPQTDTIEIIGNRAEVPSNLAIPEQTENYIFPITINKPDYRVYVREPGQYKMFVMHGQFPLQRVVNDIRGGKSIFEVINHFTFLEAGQRIVNVNGNVKNANLSVNQVGFNSTLNVRAPSYPASQAMIALSLAEKDGLFLPTDLKRLTPNQTMGLKTNTSLGQPLVLSLLVDQPKSNTTPADQRLREILNPFVQLHQPLTLGELDVIPSSANYDFNKLTFVLSPRAGTVTPQFLPTINAPQISGHLMRIQTPSLPNGLTAAATYLVFSEIEELGTGKMKNERRTRLWEIWSEGWIPQFEMPKVTFAKNPKRKYRWEVMFLARPSNVEVQSTPTSRVDINTITHVTRNALDF